MSDLMMLVRTEDANSFGDWTFRFSCQPVTVDTSGRGKWDVTLPLSYREHSELADLAIEAFRDTTGPAHMYSPSVSYRPYRVNLSEAEDMVKVLRKVTRGVDRLSGKYGYPKDAATYCAYVAESLGIKSDTPFIRQVEPDRDYDGSGYRAMNTDSLRDWLHSQEQAWEKKHGMPSHD